MDGRAQRARSGVPPVLRDALRVEVVQIPSRSDKTAAVMQTTSISYRIA